MNDLRIASDLVLPLEAVTQTFGVLGKRGVGKSYTASVLVEELLKAGMQVVVIDPLDAWWGLRSSANGESEGLPIVIFGGAHGDVPLEATSGSVIADLVVEQGLSALLSLRHLSKTKQRQFVAGFCERLYHRKGEDQYRQPLHIAIDEADAFIPQRVSGDVARVTGAVDDLVRRGRSSGLGVTVITQRAAVIHKDVLTQIEVLIALRTVSPQDRKALETWIEAHDAHDQRDQFMGSLASLPIGTAWFWSPGWLGAFQKVSVRQRETFDSSATPAFGESVHTPRAVADVDLDAVRTLMAETIERSEAEDPKQLRRRITELEQQLNDQKPRVQHVEVPVLEPGQAEQLQATAGELATIASAIQASLERAVAPAAPSRNGTKHVRQKPERPGPAPPKREDSDLKLRAGERRMLQAVAQLEPDRITRTQLATLSGFTVTGGTFQSYLSNLKRNELIDENHGYIGITENGLAELGGEIPRQPQTTDELVGLWSSMLRSGERAMLDELVRIYPDEISRDELGERTGYTASGGTFGSYLSKLRRNGLIDVEGSRVSASATLFIGEKVNA